MCVSSQSPYSIGARRKWRFFFTAKKFCWPYALSWDRTGVETRQSTLFSVRFRIRLGQFQLLFLIRLTQKQSKDPETWVPISENENIQSVSLETAPSQFTGQSFASWFQWDQITNNINQCAGSVSLIASQDWFVPHIGCAFVLRIADILASRPVKNACYCNESRPYGSSKARYGLTLICRYLSLVLTTHINAQTLAKSTSGSASSSLLLCSMNLRRRYNPSLVKAKRGHGPYGEGSPKFSKATECCARGHAC